MKKMSKLKVCLRHISEVFLYEYYCLGDDEYEISDEDTLTPHKEKAIGKKIAEKDLNQIQRILKDNGIPTAANSVTLALLYKAAEEAENAGDNNHALDCYRMVYDLTADEEVGKRISGFKA